MNDVRDMFPQAIRAVAEAQPLAFILENVRGLLRPAFSNYVEFIKLQMEFPEFAISENASWYHLSFRLHVQRRTPLTRHARDIFLQAFCSAG